jgi:hypothetical protein
VRRACLQVEVVTSGVAQQDRDLFIAAEVVDAELRGDLRAGGIRA